MQQFVAQDPYVVKGLVEKFEIDPVVVTHCQKDFDRIVDDFLVRS